MRCSFESVLGLITWSLIHLHLLICVEIHLPFGTVIISFLSALDPEIQTYSLLPRNMNFDETPRIYGSRGSGEDFSTLHPLNPNPKRYNPFLINLIGSLCYIRFRDMLLRATKLRV